MQITKLFSSFLVLFITLLLLEQTHQIHFQIGSYDQATNMWNGYNPACDQQCRRIKGQVCGVRVRQCCEEKQCDKTKNPPFQTCLKQKADYRCDQTQKSNRLNQIINSPKGR